MPSLPLQLVSALVLAFLFAERLLRRDGPRLFVALVRLGALSRAIGCLVRQQRKQRFRGVGSAKLIADALIPQNA